MMIMIIIIVLGVRVEVDHDARGSGVRQPEAGPEKRHGWHYLHRKGLGFRV